VIGSVGSGRGESNLKRKALHELRRFMAMFLYLWVLFGVFEVYRSMVLAESHINYQAQGFAAINALMLAKVMLLGEELHLGRQIKGRSLLFLVLYQSLIFTILFICFHLAEKGLVGVLHGKPMSEWYPEMGGGSLRAILSAGAVIFVALIPFFAFKDITRVIGVQAMRTIIFSRGLIDEASSLAEPSPDY
jgi:hypothetical protein